MFVEEESTNEKAGNAEISVMNTAAITTPKEHVDSPFDEAGTNRKTESEIRKEIKIESKAVKPNISVGKIKNHFGFLVSGNDPMGLFC